ncbi:DUF1501 domain-containing protein [Calycomorphotria hydatis]|uniref:Sulfatase n=1 Tax=Calycomorphotria hydatis TaxID=2528027 RepID=A0A517TEB4_9PLAN|nr:DUF1501 domain-containing protein [Calycomorphotria hydatis]QDT66714.1 hypothetical protein V22_39850 [Calycomorphotria hydatis]
MLSRREYLVRMSAAPGLMATSHLWAAPFQDEAKNKLHHPGKVKSIIFYYCSGGPSQGHTFAPPKKIQDESLHPFQFQKSGQSGLEISDIFPHLQKVADELCVIRSGYGAKATHNEGGRHIFTGSNQLKASLGAWMLYGLGSGNLSLPSYLMLTGRLPGDKWALNDGHVHGGARSIAAGGLPPSMQAQVVRDLSKPIDNLKAFTDHQRQQKWLNSLGNLNSHFQKRHPEVSELTSRMESFHAAYRMQDAAPEAFDLSKEMENREMQKLYGLNELATQSTGAKMVLARRLVERGVRFVLVPSMRVPNLEGGNTDWDTHTPTTVRGGLPNLARACDLPLAGLIQDLKNRDLLDQTLVVWGGEMGRGDKGFMNHNGNAFAWWMAGGGVKGGTAYGDCDDYGMTAVENTVHVRDLHATILWMCGLDYQKLKYNGIGLDDSCKVVHDLFNATT